MKDFTDITIILDSSGSMGHLKAATIEGINSFIEEQKKVPGDGCWTLIEFSDENNHRVYHKNIFPKVVFAGRPQASVYPLTDEDYHPWGGTALLDAVCMTIDNIGVRLSSLKEEERPNRVLVVIITDGEENSSKHFNLQQMKDKITHQQNVYKWTFLFLGANQDSFSNAQSYGIPVGNAMNFAPTSQGVGMSYEMVSRSVRTWKLDGNETAADLLSSCEKDVVAPSVP